MYAKTWFVKVDSHVGERFIGHRQYDVAIWISSSRYRFYKVWPPPNGAINGKMAAADAWNDSGVVSEIGCRCFWAPLTLNNWHTADDDRSVQRCYSNNNYYQRATHYCQIKLHVCSMQLFIILWLTDDSHNINTHRRHTKVATWRKCFGRQNRWSPITLQRSRATML